MMKAFQQRRWALVILWVLIIAAIVAAPSVLPVFRLNLLGRFLALAIVALGIDLIWGFTGLLSLGQGIFFALGGYAAAMYLQLNSSEDLLNGIPEFFTLYGVDRLPAFWQPFHSPLFTLVAIWLIPGVLAALLGNLVFRNRVKGVYFSILTQAALLVFFNFFHGQQKLINGTNGLKGNVSCLVNGGWRGFSRAIDLHHRNLPIMHRPDQRHRYVGRANGKQPHAGKISFGPVFMRDHGT